MTSKEKAEELWWKYYNHIEHTLSEEYSPEEKQIAKRLAFIAIDEIVQELSVLPYGRVYLSRMDYWIKVKQEIEKL